MLTPDPDAVGVDYAIGDERFVSPRHRHPHALGVAGQRPTSLPRCDGVLLRARPPQHGVPADPARRSGSSRGPGSTSRSPTASVGTCVGCTLDVGQVDAADRRPIRHDVRMIPTVSVTRYVTPLREGGSLPGIVEADDLGTYVCKFRGAGQGVRVLVAEVVVGELARRIGLATPRLVGARARPRDRALRGRRGGPGPAQRQPGPQPRRGLPARARSASTASCPRRPGVAAKVLWLDAFCANVDRTWRNPNLLFWHGDLWVIDHGASPLLPPRLGRRGHRPRPVRPAAVGPGRPRLPLVRRRAARAADEEIGDLLSAGGVRRGAGRGPRPLAGAGAGRGHADAVRAAYVGVPGRAARHASVAVGGLPRGRRVSRLAYQYVVLRCVPRVDREEFLNVGVVVYCQAADFLEVAWNVDARPAAGAGPARRRRPPLRGAVVRRGRLRRRRARRGGLGEADRHPLRVPQGPESTVLQPGPVHGGVTTDPARQLDHLLATLVG